MLGVLRCHSTVAVSTCGKSTRCPKLKHVVLAKGIRAIFAFSDTGPGAMHTASFLASKGAILGASVHCHAPTSMQCADHASLNLGTAIQSDSLAHLLCLGLRRMGLYLLCHPRRHRVLSALFAGRVAAPFRGFAVLSGFSHGDPGEAYFGAMADRFHHRWSAAGCRQRHGFLGG